MPGTFTPMQMNAGAGLLQDTGISLSPEFSGYVTQYKAIANIDDLSWCLERIDRTGNTYNYISSTSTINNLLSLGQDEFHGLTNTVTTADQSLVGETSLTQAIVDHSTALLGADLGVFAQHFSLASAFTSQSNQFITSALNIENSQGVSNDINNLLTGAVTDTTLALNPFASDILNTGDLIDYNQLTNLGNPLAFIKRYWSLAGGLPIIEKYLNKNNINSAGLIDVVNRNDPGAIINMQVSELGTQGLISYPEGITSNTVEQKQVQNINKKGLGRAVWDTLGDIKNEDLQELQNIISSNIPGLESAQDLLDPKKIFPTTYESLKSFDNNGNKGFIYKDQSFNNLFNGLGSSLYTAVPEYIADSNQALSRSLQQIKDVFNVNSQSLSQLTEKLETTKGLDTINALDKPVPDSTINFFKSLYGSGSGPNGEFLVTDVIGSIAGYTHNTEMPLLITTISALNDLGELSYLSELYYAMKAIWTNDPDYYYTVPGPIDPESGMPTSIPYWKFPPTMSGPLGGTDGYSSHDTATDALITEIESELSRIGTAYPTQKTTADANISNMSSQIKREKENLPKAGIVPADTQTGVKSSVMGLVSNLHDYGADDSLGGTGWILEQCADSTFYGEALIAALREGRNIRRMNDSGVGNSLTIESDTRTSDKATFLESEFTVEEAKNKLDL